MSANAGKGRILSLDQARERRGGPPAFSPDLVQGAITAAVTGQAGGVQLLAEQATLMLGTLGVMGSEIARFRQEVKALAQQSTDMATVNSVLLACLGGSVSVPSAWFAAYEVRGGMEVDDDGTSVTIRELVASDRPPREAPDGQG